MCVKISQISSKIRIFIGLIFLIRIVRGFQGSSILFIVVPSLSGISVQYPNWDQDLEPSVDWHGVTVILVLLRNYVYLDGKFKSQYCELSWPGWFWYCKTTRLYPWSEFRVVVWCLVCPSWPDNDCNRRYCYQVFTGVGYCNRMALPEIKCGFCRATN